MLNEGKVLALIPARAGSKRLKNKNILDLGGKPLIQWTIESAQKSEFIDDIYVSTDSKDISSLAVSLGVEMPFMRPDELASDTASSMDVVAHALSEFSALGSEYVAIVLLQPTSPLRTALDIDSAFKLMDLKGAESVVSVTECDHSPLWSNTLPDDLNMDDFIRPEVQNKRSQDLPSYYRLNGAVYVSKVPLYPRFEGFFPDSGKYAYVMPKERSVDIDDGFDLTLARAIINIDGTQS